MLCKVVGCIVCATFMRFFYLIFYYICLGLIILEVFLFVLCISVFTTLQTYCSSLDSITLKTHADVYIMVKIRINYHVTLKYSYYINTNNNIINKHSLYNTNMYIDTYLYSSSLIYFIDKVHLID